MSVNLELAFCQMITQEQIRRSRPKIIEHLNRYDIDIGDIDCRKGTRDDLIRGSLRVDYPSNEIQLIGAVISDEFCNCKFQLFDRNGQEVFVREPSS
jgi:hypothetical protein